MTATAAIYLAHLNPMTRAHEAIIERLRQGGNHVYVFPVRFIKDGREVNTKGFPFSYVVRKEMVESVFGDAVKILPDYTFYAPFVKYLPPLLSSRSWELRNKIIAQVKEKNFVSYTGDRAERLMLRAYGLRPLRASRLEISASSVRELLYLEALEPGNGKNWRDKIPPPAAEIILKNWQVVEGLAKTQDDTKKVMGMKFPREGYK